MNPSAEELALLGLVAGDPLPAGGQHLVLTIRSGNRSAHVWSDLFESAFRERFGVGLHPGSLNLWAEDPITWEHPLELKAKGLVGEFCPVILDESAIGAAFRGNRLTPRYLEVLSPVRLRDRLPYNSDGACISVRLLPGEFLRRAA